MVEKGIKLKYKIKFLKMKIGIQKRMRRKKRKEQAAYFNSFHIKLKLQSHPHSLNCMRATIFKKLNNCLFSDSEIDT